MGFVRVVIPVMWFLIAAWAFRHGHKVVGWIAGILGVVTAGGVVASLTAPSTSETRERGRG